MINALFVDTEGDTTEATWIGKLAVIPHVNQSNAVVFDSVNQEVEIVGKGTLKATMVKDITFTENGTLKFTQTVHKQNGNPTIHVIYSKPQAKFDVTFYKNHLNVDWSMNYDRFYESHGLMGKLNCVLFLSKFLSFSNPYALHMHLIYHLIRSIITLLESLVLQ